MSIRTNIDCYMSNNHHTTSHSPISPQYIDDQVLENLFKYLEKFKLNNEFVLKLNFRSNFISFNKNGLDLVLKINNKNQFKCKIGVPAVELAPNVLITHLGDSHVHSGDLLEDCGHA